MTGENELQLEEIVTFPWKINDDITLVEKIAEDGMGLLCRAERKISGLIDPEIVAVKTFNNSSLAAHLYKYEKRIFSEIAAMYMLLKHQNILRLQGTVEGKSIKGNNNAVYLVMDYCENTFRDYLNKYGLPEKQEDFYNIITIISQTVEGLAHAHEQGMIHRDINPSNIFVGDLCNVDCDVKLGDFSIVKIDPEVANKILVNEPVNTRIDQVLGTCNYRAPEQTKVGGLIDERTDLWQIGVVLYEALSGQMPFSANEIGELHDIIQKVNPRTPLKGNEYTPKDLGVITLKLLEKNPNRRYQSAKELSQDLNAFLLGNSLKTNNLISYSFNRSRQIFKNRPMSERIGLSAIPSTLILTLLFNIVTGSSLKLDFDEYNALQLQEKLELQILTDTDIVDVLDELHSSVDKKMFHWIKEAVLDEDNNARQRKEIFVHSTGTGSGDKTWIAYEGDRDFAGHTLEFLINRYYQTGDTASLSMAKKLAHPLMSYDNKTICHLSRFISFIDLVDIVKREGNSTNLAFVEQLTKSIVAAGEHFLNRYNKESGMMMMFNKTELNQRHLEYTLPLGTLAMQRMFPIIRFMLENNIEYTNNLGLSALDIVYSHTEKAIQFHVTPEGLGTRASYNIIENRHAFEIDTSSSLAVANHALVMNGLGEAFDIFYGLYERQSDDKALNMALKIYGTYEKTAEYYKNTFSDFTKDNNSISLVASSISKLSLIQIQLSNLIERESVSRKNGGLLNMDLNKKARENYLYAIKMLQWLFSDDVLDLTHESVEIFKKYTGNEESDSLLETNIYVCDAVKNIKNFNKNYMPPVL